MESNLYKQETTELWHQKQKLQFVEHFPRSGEWWLCGREAGL